MPREPIRPIREWAVGKAPAAQDVIVIRFDVRNRPPGLFAMPSAEAASFARAILAETGHEKG